MQITSDSKLRAVIIGGGISGLSAAWYLEKQAKENNIPLAYSVLEQASRWGGKIQTDIVHEIDGQPFIVEGGPDSFLTQKPWALQLARELGLEETLLGTNDTQRHVYVLNKGKPVILPDGVLLIVPTKFMPFVLSPLISPLGKLRMGMDLFIRAKRDDEDETLADFVRRRLGNEALDKIAEPLMSGIYNAEAERQSLLATFPRFRQIEKDHGSLIKGMLASRRKRQAATSSTPATGKKLSAFMSFTSGTQTMTDALTQQLSGDLRTDTTVSAITANLGGGYTIAIENGVPISADVVILTTPASVTAGLVQDFAANAAQQLEAIRYVSTGTISLAFRQEDLPDWLHGFGVVVPSSEKRPINAITISSIKFDHRAPQGYVLLRAFFGGSRSPESMALDDEELLRVVRQQLQDILSISHDPLFHRIYRWWNANPQYDLGHIERVAAIENDLPAGIYVTGSAYRGVGMPDCVHQSQQTAEKIVAAVQAPVTT